MTETREIGSHPSFDTFEIERSAIFARLGKAEIARANDEKPYLQCLITPVSRVDGTELSAFDVRRKPSDEKDDWRAMGIEADVGGGTRLQYYVDRYDGPRGSGFILGATVEYRERDWSYREHVGPEKRSGFDAWAEVTREED